MNLYELAAEVVAGLVQCDARNCGRRVPIPEVNLT
jgi:hypothetical protein